jgi:benzoyl-CoA reductase/2-hydroxyglutaryl-CoA dehydratase subunit BcrC/BadD/HgdB
MSATPLLQKFEQLAGNPKGQFATYLASDRKVILCAPYYAPNEIVHSMGLIPFGAWGADTQLEGAKQYFPAFICSVVQSIVELGIRGDYTGASALIVPSLCDSLKVLGENFKYAVPSIPFIPLVYPQNRKVEAATAFTTAGYERVIRDLEKATGAVFSVASLTRSIEIYNEHNVVMRNLSVALAAHPEVTATQRSAIYKSAYFLEVEEHTALVRDLLAELTQAEPGVEKTRIITSGILTDSPALTAIFDENGLQIVGDDVAAESRQYATDTPEATDPLRALALKHRDRDNCSVLYDPEKKRIDHIIALAKERKANGVVLVLTKFCDPEEFDVPLIKRACDEAKLPFLLIEIDRQSVNLEQAKTAISAFAEML